MTRTYDVMLFMDHFLIFHLQGLKLGDLVIRFGTITDSNFSGLPAIGSLVQHSKGVRDFSLYISPFSQEWCFF